MSRVLVAGSRMRRPIRNLHIPGNPRAFDLGVGSPEFEPQASTLIFLVSFVNEWIVRQGLQKLRVCSFVTMNTISLSFLIQSILSLEDINPTNFKILITFN